MSGRACDPRRNQGDETLDGQEKTGSVVVCRILNQLEKFRGCSVRQRVFVVFLAAILVLAVSGTAWSQTVQGVITGTITDPTGAVVPNATVTITNIGTNISQKTTTNGEGEYRFPLVPPGAYTIEVKAANFAEVRTTGIVVEASQTVPFSVKLQLAKASEIIEVTSQTPLVQTATSDLGMQVNSETIQNAALVDRDVFGTLPFMATTVAPGIDGMPSSGGARESGTSYLLNGADDNNNFSEGAVGTYPPLESVEDFSIITNSMSAQYGRGAGAVVSANQKSGTNKFHGVLYEQNRNATLNANDFFYNRDLGNSGGTLPSRPKYIKNQFGGTVGGPIKKDKTFFFIAIDRFKLEQGSTSANNFEPTSAALAYVKAHGGPLAQSVLSQYDPVTSDTPCPNLPGTGAGLQADGTPNTVGCLSFSNPVTTTQNVYYGRVDHNFSTSDRLSFTANVTRYTQLNLYGGGSILTSGPISGSCTLNAHNLAAIETHTFNPRLFNEVNLSHNRFANPFVEGNPAKQTAPEIVIDNQNEGGLNYNFGPGEGGQIESFVQDRWALQDNLTWTLGRHAVRLGGTGSYGILYRNWDLGQPGYYEFGELFAINDGSANGPGPAGTGCAAGALITPACDPGTNSTGPTVGPPPTPGQNIPVLQANGTIANVALEPNSNFAGDYPYFQETSINPTTGAKADAYRHYTYHDYAAFVQDDWKITPKLTLNLGLRWERFGAPAEDHGNLAQFTNLNCNLSDPTCIGNARVTPVSRMWNTRNGDLGPRVGFAWDPFGGGKTAVRGSYGIYYDRIFDNIWSNGAWNPPFYALIDFEADAGDAVFYSNPASIGGAYNPANPIPYPGKRVSVRTMDVNMKDSSAQNYYLSVEHQFFGGLLLRAGYQGQFGRHLAMLENYNREDGIGYGVANPTSLSAVRPNALYSGFNYRSNSVSSGYNALVFEAQKHMGHGLQFQTGYTYSKLMDYNSELFAGCSTIGSYTAPYYYISNQFPQLNHGPGAENHTNAFKFNFTYELPFLKHSDNFASKALGGWTFGSFFQFYSGHPIDVYDGAAAIRAKTLVPFNGTTCKVAAGCPTLVLDPNGVPYNIGGDYNLDGVLNDHPVFIGSNLGAVYSGANPADGIFTNNNRIGCGFPGMPASISTSVSSSACPSTPNTLFGNPAYPGSGLLYERFGTLARDVFHGPQFAQMDLGLKKTFKITESMNLRISADAQNLFNHPNFDCVQANLNSGTFGKAQCLVGTASRVMSLSARFAF